MRPSYTRARTISTAVEICICCSEYFDHEYPLYLTSTELSQLTTVNTVYGVADVTT